MNRRVYNAGAACFLALMLVGCARLGQDRKAAESAPPAAILSSSDAVAAVFTGQGLAGADGETQPAASEKTTLTLEQVLAVAYEKNPTFAEFDAARRTARAEVIAALAWPNPELEAGLGVVSSREAPTQSALSYSLGLTQPIELPAKRRARRAAAEASGPIVEREEELFRVQLRTEVSRAYFTVLLYEHGESLARELLQTQRQVEEIVGRRAGAGEVPEIDRTKIQVETLKAARAVRAQARNAAAARAVLNALCGRALPADFALADTLETSPTGADIEKAREIALLQHPTLRRLETIQRQKELVVRREQKAWYPDLQPGIGLEQGLDDRTFGATLGMVLPLWYRNRGGIEAAKAELEKTEAEIRRVRQDIERDVETGAEAYESAREQLAAFSAGLRSAAAQSLHTETLLYQEGESDFLRLLDAQRTARQTESEYLQAMYDAQIARMELERAIGIGGEKP